MNAAGDVLVATGTDGRIAGVVALATGMRRAVLDFERRHIRGARPFVTLARGRQGTTARRAERLDAPKSGLPDPGRKFLSSGARVELASTQDFPTTGFVSGR